MKKCPYCAEQIQDEAIKCRFCHEFLNNANTSIEPQIEMVFVQGGTFQMGSNDAGDNEKPVHSVTLSDFYIGKYQVTQKEWQEIMGDNPSEFKGENLPVTNISWNDCQDFLNEINAKTGNKYRLPTEAEWEFAARGGNQSRGYKYSGSNDLDSVAWHYGNSGEKPHCVGQKQPNELGIHDMSGNVCEWCSDWYSKYGSGSQANPQGALSGDYRVLRGSSYYYYGTYCRVAYRSSRTPSYIDFTFGLRLASDC